MTSILGGLSPARFLRDHWQKRPLLIRQALPGFRGLFAPAAFLKLATRADATSRLVIEHPGRGARGRWERHDGPFGGLDAGMLPPRQWTLLVNSVESLVPGGWELLRRFSFIPAARVDDLMVSYAADGGSVGPHDDLYDVFLLQGPGRRRWQVSRQRDRDLDPLAAIKVLRSFVPEDEWLLEPGDMLYLPPGVAHWGVAEGPCFTYSIGFLAPSRADLLRDFLAYLGEASAARSDPAARYQDGDLRPTRRPFDLADDMLDKVGALLGRVRWGRDDVGDFLGRYLTRPKPQMRFAPPRRPLAVEPFAARLRGPGRLTLALSTRGLVRGGRLYLNGDAHAARPATRRLFRRLLAERSLPLPLPLALPRASAAASSADARERLLLLHRGYAAGHLRLS